MNRNLRVVLIGVAVCAVAAVSLILPATERLLAADGGYMDNAKNYLGECSGRKVEKTNKNCVSPTWCQNEVSCEAQSFPNCPVAAGQSGSGQPMNYQRILAADRKQYGACIHWYQKTCYRCEPYTDPLGKRYEGKILCAKATVYRYSNCTVACWAPWYWLSPAYKCLWQQQS